MSHRLSAQELKKASTTALDELGALRHGPFGRTFRYVWAQKKIQKFRVCGGRSTGPTVKSGWNAGQSANVVLSARPYGVAIGLISASQYGYVCASGPLGVLGGVSVYAFTDGGVAAGEQLVKDETAATGRFDTLLSTTAGTQIGWIMGNATLTDSGSYLAGGNLRNVWGDG